jgi:hypothetical protein
MISKWLCLSVSVVLALACHARDINWFSDAGAVNLDSDGLVMNREFKFELGVFSNGFVPTPANLQHWAANWNACQRTSYNPQTNRFDGLFTVTTNSSPFVAGAAAYVWGFRGVGESGEWILFRAPGWLWPMADEFNPLALEWNTAQATAIVGSIHAGGSPHLMKSVPVTNALPPETDWSQWASDELAGQSMDQPGDDPDRDGIPNMLEYVFGTAPLVPNGAAATRFSLPAGRPTLLVPRRPDRPASLTVQVSDDLVHWNSGPGFTEVVAATIDAIEIRAVGVESPADPRVFMRVRAELP